MPRVLKLMQPVVYCNVAWSVVLEKGSGVSDSGAYPRPGAFMSELLRVSAVLLVRRAQAPTSSLFYDLEEYFCEQEPSPGM